MAKCKKHPGVEMITDECPKCTEETRIENAVNKAREDELSRVAALTTLGEEFGQAALAKHAIENKWDEAQLKTEILGRIKKASAGGPLNIKVTPMHEGKPFRSLGEQLQAVASAPRGDHSAHQKLREVYNAPAGASEAVPADGGTLVQSDFTTALLDLSHQTAVLLPKCYEIPVNGNGTPEPGWEKLDPATGRITASGARAANCRRSRVSGGAPASHGAEGRRRDRG